MRPYAWTAHAHKCKVINYVYRYRYSSRILQKLSIIFPRFRDGSLPLLFFPLTYLTTEVGNKKCVKIVTLRKVTFFLDSAKNTTNGLSECLKIIGQEVVIKFYYQIIKLFFLLTCFGFGEILSANSQEKSISFSKIQNNIFIYRYV